MPVILASSCLGAQAALVFSGDGNISTPATGNGAFGAFVQGTTLTVTGQNDGLFVPEAVATGVTATLTSTGPALEIRGIAQNVTSSGAPGSIQAFDIRPIGGWMAGQTLSFTITLSEALVEGGDPSRPRLASAFRQFDFNNGAFVPGGVTIDTSIAGSLDLQDANVSSPAVGGTISNQTTNSFTVTSDSTPGGDTIGQFIDASDGASAGDLTSITYTVTVPAGADPYTFPARITIDGTIAADVVPEPSTALLGFAGLALLARRKR